MKTTPRPWQLLRDRPWHCLGLLGVTLLLLAAAGLHQSVRHAAEAARLPAARLFEQSPDDWLGQPRDASHFQHALQSDALAVVAWVMASPGLVLYTLRDGERASTVLPGCAAAGCAGGVMEHLTERSGHNGFALVDIHIDPRPLAQRWLEGIEAALPPVLLLAAAALLLPAALRLQARIGGRATRLTERPSTRFADVIGADEAKAALQRVCAFLHDPARYAALGARPPRGVLLVGPPGTGKTLMARALAGESAANFIAVDGSYFTAMFYGAGVAKVREVFKLARSQAPCVLFIDEIDGIGRRSHGGPGGGADSELNRIINRVLVEMDGFDALDNVVVVGASNHPDNIDAALRRPGRFDHIVRLSLPTQPDRVRMFERCLQQVRADGAADAQALARMTAGLSPADIANLVNKAASSAAERGDSRVGGEHLLSAIETQQLGGEISALHALLSPSTRARLAWHEAGHALVAHGLSLGVVERVTIEPRGEALGVTFVTRDSEDPLYRQDELDSRLAMMLAGREAELLVLGSVSSGASDDLKRASELAVKMVGTLGFSTSFGLLSVDGVPPALLGPDVQQAVLDEARALLLRAQQACRALLVARRGQLQALAQALLERERLSGDLLQGLLAAPDVAADLEIATA